MSIYHHFSLDEREWVDRVLDWKNQVKTAYIMKRTPFLNPREQYIVECVIGASDTVQIFKNKEFEGLERQRFILAPSFYEIHPEDFHVSLLQINYPTKFHTLKHSQVLGACMNLGIKRQMLGDILVVDKRIQIIAAKEIVPFVYTHLTMIHHVKVNITEITFSERLKPKEVWKEEQTTISSRRLDIIVSKVAKLSRQKAQDLIEKEYVQVNYQICVKPDRLIQTGDFLSIQKAGRVKIKSFLEKTKKDKERMVYEQLG